MNEHQAVPDARKEINILRARIRAIEERGYATNTDKEELAASCIILDTLSKIANRTQETAEEWEEKVSRQYKEAKTHASTIHGMTL